MHHQPLGSHSRRRRRRLSLLSGPATVASCVAALATLNRGDCISAVASFSIAGGCAGSPVCFIGAASGGGGRALRKRRGRGRSQGVASAPLPATVATHSGNTGERTRSGRQASSLTAWGLPAGGQSVWEAAAADARGAARTRRAGGGRPYLYMVTAAVETGDDGIVHAPGTADASDLVAGGAGMAADGTGVDGGEASALQSQELTKMKLPELKALYREGGGKPGTLRKAELVERLTLSLEGKARDEPRLETATVPPATGSTQRADVPDTQETEEVSVVALAPAGASPESAPRREGFVDGDLLSQASIRAGDEESSASEQKPMSSLTLGAEGDTTRVPVSEGGGTAAPSHAEAGNGSASRDGRNDHRHDDAGSIANLPAVDVSPPGPAQLGLFDAPQRGEGLAGGHADVVGDEEAGDDVLSRGPSAVVAAARARGAAAAAASARVAAGGRARAMAEAKRHTEAVRSRAAHGWTQSPEGRQQHNGLLATQEGLSASMSATAMSDPSLAQAAELRDVSGQPSYSTRPAAATRGRELAGGNANNPRPAPRRLRADDTPVQRVGGRPRLMPKMPNPWSRAGRGGAAEGLPEEGDVVEEFLTETMMQASDKERCSSGDELFNRESRFETLPGSPMQLHFLGTASCIPSTSRGVSCTVLRNEGDLWMFDVGEGTQVQIQRSSIKPTKITKIFITHAHGDHSFGLPGMLCLMGQNYERSSGKRVEVYGPTGLRAYLRAALRYTYSKVTVPYVVHELRDVRHLHGDVVRRPEDFHLDIEQDYRYGEQRGGRDIYPDKNGHYELYRDEKAVVRAAPMKHGVPCVGYCVEEPDRPGRLKIEHISPILNEHKEAVQEATGKKGLGWVLGSLKSMKPGDSITLPGTDLKIHSADAVEPPTKGRKVVILGDTCDSSSMVPLAMGADVVVHEATNAFLPPVDQGKTYADVEREAIEHGHSTPVMAAAFAAKVGAKTLILNHFSARYRGDASDASTAVMLRIERQAMRAAGLERHQVVAAWDLLQLPVLAIDQWENHREQARGEDEAHAAILLERATMRREGDRVGSSLPEIIIKEEQDAAPKTQPSQVSQGPSQTDGAGGVNLEDLVRNQGAHAFVPGQPSSSSREGSLESTHSRGQPEAAGITGNAVQSLPIPQPLELAR